MKRILLVGDNESFRTAFAKMIERSGYLVTQAADGRAGLIRFQAETPDLVICDLIMPDVEGLQTIQEMLRRDPGWWRDQPVGLPAPGETDGRDGNRGQAFLRR